ncbi:MAG: hypothetical protein IKX93_08290 [Bacteroidaceae bacterium]|nr:hypothetical protein [Bacteroidaceae bacterium]MBR5764605.1 hypothetical protein [Bacteroidaceae bacterium]
MNNRNYFAVWNTADINGNIVVFDELRSGDNLSSVEMDCGVGSQVIDQEEDIRPEKFQELYY